MSKRALLCGALWLSVSSAVFLIPGCYGHNCDFGVVNFGVDAGTGVMVNEDTWSSSPMNGDWLPYNRQHLYVFDIKALGGRTPDKVIPYISAAPRPNTTGDDWTIGAGNLAKLKWAGPNHIEIFNDSCSDYFLNLVVEVPPFPPPLPDGGAPAADLDASPTDASPTDASPADASDAN